MTQFQRAIPINIAGGSYESRTRPLSSQRTVNLYPQLVEQGKEQFILHSFPGLNPVGSVTGADRGMEVMREIGYRVAGETLYEFTADGTHTSLGEIVGTERCIFSNDGFNLIIVADSNVYQYNIYDGLSEIDDANLSGSTAVTFINNQMVYTNNGLFVTSDVSDPDSANGLNAAGAESQPDDLLRAYSFQQTVYMFGTRSTEPWWNTGDGFPPLARMDGQILEVGCQAIHSIANSDEFLYFLGDDNAIYQTSGGQKRRVSTLAITHAIAQYATRDDAIGYTFTFDGTNFYCLTFPAENKTWCMNETLQDKGWFELSSGLDNGKYQGNSLVYVYGANYLADADNGNLYLLDIDTFTNNSEIIKRQRVTSSVNSKLFGQAGKRLQMSRFELLMETGLGDVDVDPKVAIDISFDGGRSWVSKGFVDVGQAGESDTRVQLDCLDTFHDAIFRVTATDPVSYEIYSASIDLRLAGW